MATRTWQDDDEEEEEEGGGAGGNTSTKKDRKMDAPQLGARLQLYVKDPSRGQFVRRAGSNDPSSGCAGVRSQRRAIASLAAGARRLLLAILRGAALRPWRW